MKIAVYPGSFDPMTLGHIDIIKRVSPVFDRFIVLISHSPEKKYFFSESERVNIARDELKDIKNVEVQSHKGLTVDFVKKVNAQVIVRGLRAVSDFEYEMAMATVNKRLHSEAETMIVFASPEFNALSSRMVKEVAKYKGSVKGMVSTRVERLLLDKLTDNRGSHSS